MAEAFTGPRLELLLLFCYMVMLSNCLLHIYTYTVGRPGLLSTLAREASLCGGQQPVERGRAGQSASVRLSAQP